MALKGRDRAPNTLGALGNLAVTLQNQGKPAEAEPLFREALAARRSRGARSRATTTNKR